MQKIQYNWAIQAAQTGTIALIFLSHTTAGSLTSYTGSTHSYPPVHAYGDQYKKEKDRKSQI